MQDIDSDPGLPGAAGSLVSSGEDLARMIHLLFNRAIVQDSSLAMMKTLKSRSIGHGLFKMPFYGKTGWGHSGRIDEYRAFVCYFPADSLALAITTNGTGLNLNEVVTGLLSTWYGREYAFPATLSSAPLDPEVTAFAGSYKAKLFRLITVAHFKLSVAGKNHLFVSEDKGEILTEKALLTRTDNYRFTWRENGSELTFSHNKKGRIKGAVLKQGKLSIHCKKKH